MEVVLLEKPTKDEINDIVDTLTLAFDKDPLFNCIFNYDKYSLRLLIKAYAEYYIKQGVVFVCKEKEKNKIIGASIWAKKGYKELTICAIFTSLTLLWIFIRMIFRGIPSVYRLSKVSDIIEKYRPYKKHIFLSIIGSNKKGGGTLLMNKALEYFGENETLYLECSDPNVNEHFYNKFQFKMFGLETYKGIKEGFMIRIGKNQNIDEFIKNAKNREGYLFKKKIK